MGAMHDPKLRHANCKLSFKIGHLRVHRFVCQTLRAFGGLSDCHVNLKDGMQLDNPALSGLLRLQPSYLDVDCEPRSSE
jgi:hypothetical protein